MGKRKKVRTNADGRGTGAVNTNATKGTVLDVDPAAEALAEAKAKFDAAKQKKASLNAAITKHKRTLKDGPKRVEKLKEQIVRAKANTTKSAEELLKKASEMEKETKKLEKETTALEKEAAGLYREQEDLRIELGEIRESNKAKRPGEPRRGTGMSSAKISLVKALSRRQYVVQYGPGDAPAAVGAKSLDGRLVLILNQDDFSMSILGAKPTIRAYGAGSIMSIETALRALPEIASGDSAKKTGTK